MIEKQAYEYKCLMDFYPPNKIVYESIHEHLRTLSPFVGAGLSAFAYPMWQKLFLGIIDYMPNNDYKSQIQCAIEEDDYFRAGDLVYNCLQAPTFFELLKRIFGQKKISIDKLKNEPVYLIPQIFEGLCFTTNFDKVLEFSFYECKKPFMVATPNDSKLISESIKDNTTVIFKIHGDIDGNADELVLTGTAYGKHYSPKSALSKQLSLGMRSRRLLFLGASLKKDRTMDMLKKTIAPGNTNFAIIGVNTEEEIESRQKELAALGISAIFYPINSQNGHFWVKTVLEWLKDDFMPSNEMVDLIISNDRYYKYSCNHRATKYIFHGDCREKIEAFLSCKDKFLWWDFVSMGGGGKSRFALEISDLAVNEGWNVQAFNLLDFQNIYVDPNQMDEKTLYIFDDSDYYNFSLADNDVNKLAIDANKFLKWLKFLINKSSTNNKLRIIFLHNSSTSQNPNDEHLWWKGIAESFNPMNINKYMEESFCIDLNLDELMGLIEDYSKTIYKAHLSKAMSDEIRNWFENSDDLSVRIPLVGMLFVDAFFSNVSLDEFKDQLYERIVQIEHLRMRMSLRANLEQYIKNIQIMAEYFYKHGHVNFNEVQHNNDLSESSNDFDINGVVELVSSYEEKEVNN